MNKIAKKGLYAGLCLPSALRDATGRVLLGQGTVLRAEHVAKLARPAGPELFAEGDWPAELIDGNATTRADSAPTSDTTHPSDTPHVARRPPTGARGRRDATGAGSDAARTTISLDALRPGMKLAQDVFDTRGVLLLAAGTYVTGRALELLRHRNIHNVILGAPGEVAGYGEKPSVQDQVSEIEALLSRDTQRAVRQRRLRPGERPRLSLRALHEEVSRGLEKHMASSIVVTEVYDSLFKGHHTTDQAMRGVIGDFVDMVALDFDLLPLIVSMQRSQDEYLFDHSVNVALMSMTIGAQLGWQREQIFELGIGALLADAGMLGVPDEIRLAPRILTSDERLEVKRHPYMTLDCLDRVTGVPMSARFIAYQVHERGDRSGYPTRKSGMYLHPAARVVAVADAYSAMIRPRPHRHPLAPYEAARTILIDASRRRFDGQVVRAFLDLVSIFPTGCLVQLNDGTRAQVIRANPGTHTRPVLEVLDDDRRSTGHLLDLNLEPRLKVERTEPVAPQLVLA